MIAQYIPYALAVVLLAAMVIEMRTGRIPNWLSLMPVVLFVVTAALHPDPTTLGWQLGLAVIVFAVGILLFLASGFGAGAVKLMAGVALFVPLDKGVNALMIFVAALFLGTLVFLFIRAVVGNKESAWHALAKNVMPMTVPIGITGLCVLFWL